MSAWALITTQSAADAARHASAEEIHGLRTLVDTMATQSASDQWSDVASAVYFGIGEASGNAVFESLVYDLWLVLAGSGGQWDVAARLWPSRPSAERSLQAVVTAIADARPESAAAAMHSHINGR